MSEDNAFLRQLGNLLSKIRERLDAVIGEIKQFKQAVINGFKEIRDAIHENIQAQAELQILSKMANVHTYETKIEAREMQIPEEQNELEQRRAGIRDRYDGKHAELENEARSRIRELGAHIFDIMENQFEMHVEQPLLTHVSNAWADFLKENERISNERRNRLEDKFKQTIENANSILNSEQELLNKLDRYLHDNTNVEPSIIHIPFWIVTKKENGQIKKEIIPPSRVDFQKGIPTLERSEGFENIMNSLVHKKNKMKFEDLDCENINFNKMKSEYNLPKYLNYDSVFQNITNKKQILVALEV